MRLSFKLCAAAFTLFGLSFLADASTIDAVYAFGDSLSDAGNIFALTHGAEPAAPYVNGEFGNGPVWVQDLAAQLGAGPLTASLLGGTDYAYGAAETGTTPVHTANFTDLTGVGGQVTQFQSSHPVADPNALYTIWIGANDLADLLASAPSGSQVAVDIGAMVGNVDTAIGDLAADGAKNFLIVTVPDLGKTPAALANGAAAVAAASAASLAFDTTLVNGGGSLPSLAQIAALAGVRLSVMDTYSLLDDFVSNHGKYGFTNVTSPCLTGAVNFAGGTPCSPTLAGQDQYLFWDEDHPTAAAHALLADAAVPLVTPEPVTMALAATGLLALAALCRRSLPA